MLKTQSVEVAFRLVNQEGVASSGWRQVGCLYHHQKFRFGSIQVTYFVSVECHIVGTRLDVGIAFGFKFIEFLNILFSRTPYHLNCLKCSSCKKKLTPGSLSEHEKKLYCESCYKEIFNQEVNIQF